MLLIRMVLLIRDLDKLPFFNEMDISDLFEMLKTARLHSPTLPSYF